MNDAASRGQSAATPKVIGIGAAVAAFAVTLAVVMMPSSQTTTPQQVAATTAAESSKCYVVQRKLLVAAATENAGTVRFRSGNWVSPPMVLSTVPQPIVFPLPRPQTEPVAEFATIEGNATGLILTSDVTEYRRFYDSILGSAPLNLNWAPVKTC